MPPIFHKPQLIELSSTSSTNTEAQQRLKHTPPEGSVIWAHHQTDGRGQTGNTWQVAPGQNLTFSLILYPSFLPNDHLFYLSKLTSTALRSVLMRHLPSHEVKIKWPNDLLLDGKKVCGILIENQFEGPRLKSTIIGIGLNVNQQHFPGELASRATSIYIASGWRHELRDLLLEFRQEFEQSYGVLREGGLAHIDRAYFEGLYGYQEYVPLVIDGEIGEHLIIGVNKAGQLAVEVKGRIRYFNMKEVSWKL